MKAFEVFLNGKRLCRAGIGNDGVLDAVIDYVGGDGRDHLHMHVGGLNSATDEFVNWVPLRNLKVGDEVSVRIVETNRVDRPKEQKPGEQVRREMKRWERKKSPQTKWSEKTTAKSKARA